MKAIIRVDQKTALKAGLDNQGDYTIDFIPAELTQDQREELATCATKDGAYIVNSSLRTDLPGIAAPTLENLHLLIDARIKLRQKNEEENAEKEKKRQADGLENAERWLNWPLDDCLDKMLTTNGNYYYIRFGPYGDDVNDRIKANDTRFTEKIDELKSLIFWLDLDDQIDDMICKKNERLANEKKEREREAAEKRKANQLEEWVLINGTDNQKGRYAIGMLSEEEIIDCIRDQAFAGLCDITKYKRIKKSEVCDCDYDTCEVDFNVENAKSLTADEFENISFMKTIVPEATITVRRHSGYGDECKRRVCRTGYKVEIRVGELDLSREYGEIE